MISLRCEGEYKKTLTSDIVSFCLSFLFHLNHTVTKGILNSAAFFFARFSSEVFFFRINKKRFVNHSTKPILIGPVGSSIKLFWALFSSLIKTLEVQVLFLLYEDLRSDLKLIYRTIRSMFSNWNNELTKTFLTSDCCQLEGD